jgi:hypothetical protein
MLNQGKNRNSLSFAAALCALAVSAGLGVARAEDGPQANARSTDTKASAATQPRQAEAAAKPSEGLPGRPYFVEFRARSAYNYGHTFVVHGRVGEPITAKSVVGLHPAGDSVPWTIGHFIPVPSETGWSDGDVGYNDKYIIAKYRVYLTEAEYRTVLGKMRQMQRNTPLWHAAIYNCNAFTGDIARFMGLDAPFHWAMPKDYVNGIKEMAGGRQQLPSTWLASVNPAAAREQAREEIASRARETNSRPQPAPAPNARRQQATGMHTAARPQTETPTAPSYATAQ